MKLTTVEGDPLMLVRRIRPEKGRLVIEGEIMGALPVQAVLTPAEARAAFGLLGPRTILFLLTFPFRRGS